ncbi:MAG: helix-turn-helix domain-containing protein, partial [Cyanobium sp.]
PDRLGAGDLVLRQVAALLDPSLLEERPGDGERLREGQGLSAFDDLIDYIRANLDQPLRLSDLERRSHYSRRSLQYAFRNKLGSTPKQWIRQQRLQAAIDQLRNGDRSWSVQAVALRCGYRSLSLFSADFKRQFGLSPSQARRRPLLQSSPSPPMGSARPTTAGKVGKTV